MFVVTLTYVKPLSEVDVLLDEHVRFLDRNYAVGHFLASGRRVPRTGGVILVRQMEKNRLENILRDDPFQKNGVATYEIVEFAPSKFVDGMMSFFENA